MPKLNGLSASSYAFSHCDLRPTDAALILPRLPSCVALHHRPPAYLPAAMLPRDDTRFERPEVPVGQPGRCVDQVVQPAQASTANPAHWHQHPVAHHQRYTHRPAGTPGPAQPGRVGQASQVAGAGLIAMVGSRSNHAPPSSAGRRSGPLVPKEEAPRRCVPSATCPTTRSCNANHPRAATEVPR
jgi:hypothetical protein